MTFYDITTGHFYHRQSGCYRGVTEGKKHKKVSGLLRKIYRLERKNITIIDTAVPPVDNNNNNIKNTMELFSKKRQEESKNFRADWEIGLFPDDLIQKPSEKNTQQGNLNDIWNTIGLDLRKAFKEIKTK